MLAATPSLADKARHSSHWILCFRNLLCKLGSKCILIMLILTHLVKKKTFSRDISVTNWYHAVPSHQNAPEAALPVHTHIHKFILRAD